MDKTRVDYILEVDPEHVMDAMAGYSKLSLSVIHNNPRCYKVSSPPAVFTLHFHILTVNKQRLLPCINNTISLCRNGGVRCTGCHLVSSILLTVGTIHCKK